MRVVEQIGALPGWVRRVLGSALGVFVMIGSWRGGLLGIAALAVMFGFVFLAIGIAEFAADEAEEAHRDR